MLGKWTEQQLWGLGQSDSFRNIMMDQAKKDIADAKNYLPEAGFTNNEINYYISEKNQSASGMQLMYVRSERQKELYADMQRVLRSIQEGNPVQRSTEPSKTLSQAREERAIKKKKSKWLLPAVGIVGAIFAGLFFMKG